MTIQPSSAGTTGPLPCPFCGEPPTVEMGGDAAQEIEALPLGDFHECQRTARIQLVVLNALKAVAQPTQGGDKGEAVAWQAREKAKGPDWFWEHCDIPHLNPKYEYRPLYAAPLPASNAQRPTHSQLSELDDASNACLELAAKHGYATGHGDTVGDMIREFSSQIPNVAYSAWQPIETAPKAIREYAALYERNIPRGPVVQLGGSIEDGSLFLFGHDALSHKIKKWIVIPVLRDDGPSVSSTEGE